MSDTTGPEHHTPHYIPTHRPTRDNPVWVQCSGFRCIAYVDNQGKWRSLSRDEELAEVLNILGPA